MHSPEEIMVDETREVAPGVKLQPPVSSPRYVSMYNVEELKVGGMWFFPDKDTRRHGNYMHRRAKKVGAKVQCQFATMRKDQEGRWVPCKQGAPGARNGCAVTRVS